MRNPVDWVKRMLAEKPKQNHEPPWVFGVIGKGKHLELCSPEAAKRGVKIITVPDEIVNRYGRVMHDYERLQEELSRLPQSLRKRKARKGKVALPDLET